MYHCRFKDSDVAVNAMKSAHALICPVQETPIMLNLHVSVCPTGLLFKHEPMLF